MWCKHMEQRWNSNQLYILSSGYTTSGSAPYTQSSCRRQITLNKNGGSGSITGSGIPSNSGTTNPTIYCYEGKPCFFGNPSGLTQTGYRFDEYGTSSTSQSSATLWGYITTPTQSTYYARKRKDMYILRGYVMIWNFGNNVM